MATKVHQALQDMKDLQTALYRLKHEPNLKLVARKRIMAEIKRLEQTFLFEYETTAPDLVELEDVLLQSAEAKTKGDTT